MKDLVIVGVGGFAREVHQLMEDFGLQNSLYNFIGFLDDNPEYHNKEVHGFPVLGGVSWLRDHGDAAVAVGIGSTSVRRRIVQRIQASCANSFATLVHPSARIGNRVAIGEGTIVCAGTIVTTDVSIGKHVVLGTGSTVGHDAHFDDYVTVAPSVTISGAVNVGAGCDLGTGSTIIQGINIGHWSVVGAGAVVVKDVPPNVTAVGMPAKPIKERAEGWHEE